MCEIDEYSNYCTYIKQDFYNLEITCEYEIMNKTIATSFSKNLYRSFFLLLLLLVTFIIVSDCFIRTELTFLKV